ncbi:MAG: prolipoprotein diacylglyceryl transferase [Armatimonadetes bacterium]|nr:prolipoprotein diacylglyceryl transferase [Armatimonadota bacterium]
MPAVTGLCLALAALVGSKLFVWVAGNSILEGYGHSTAGALTGAVLYAAFGPHHLGFWELMDLSSFPVLLSAAIARVGCCCQGLMTPAGHRYPVQMAEATLCAIAALAVFLFYGRRKAPGEAGLLGAGLYGAIRLLVDAGREGPR